MLWVMSHGNFVIRIVNHFKFIKQILRSTLSTNPEMHFYNHNREHHQYQSNPKTCQLQFQLPDKRIHFKNLTRQETSNNNVQNEIKFLIKKLTCITWCSIKYAQNGALCVRWRYSSSGSPLDLIKSNHLYLLLKLIKMVFSCNLFNIRRKLSNYQKWIIIVKVRFQLWKTSV